MMETKMADEIQNADNSYFDLKNDTEVNKDLKEQADSSEHDLLSLSMYFSDTFSWLEPMVHYCPIWITKKSKDDKPNNTTRNYVGLSLSVGFVLLYCILQFFYQITGWNLFTDIDNVIWCCYIVFICAARILSSIYGYNYFNWPWRHESLPFRKETDSTTKKLHKLIAKRNILYIFLAVFYVVIDLIVVILETEALLPYYHHSILTYILVKSLCRLFLLYPLAIATTIQSVIFLKYYICLNQLYENMKDISNTDMQYIFECYHKLYTLFERDYHKSLAYTVLCFLAAEVVFFWDSLNFMGMYVMFVIFVRELTIFMLYFFAASNLHEIHSKFEKKLWKNGNVLLKEMEKTHTTGYYNYILHYIQKYPIYLTIGSVIVSTKNVIKFSIGITVTRFASYAFEHWTNENY